MFCDRCGKNLGDSSTYCPNCGRAIGGSAVTPRPGRIAGHIRMLGILWLTIAAFRLFPGLIMVFLGSNGFLPPDVPGFVYRILTVVGLFLIAYGLVSGFAGWGLLTRQDWARMLAIVLGVIGLIDLPFGTALGIYTLWVLLPGASEEEYRKGIHAA